MLEKITNFIKSSQYHIFLAVCIGLVAFISFNLGKISSNEKGYLKITQDANIYKAITEDQQLTTDNDDQIQTTPKATPKPLDLRVVVSKASDSLKYHYSWCGSWSRIKPENQIWFNTEQEAINAGYTLAGNCTK